MFLSRALVFSLLVHGTVFALWWAGATFERSARSAPLIHASLVLPAAATAPPLPVVSTSVLAVPLPRPQSSPAPRRLPKTVVAPVSTPVPLDVGASTVEVVAPSLPMAETVSRVASAPREPPRTGVSAEGLRQYRFALAREARRHRHYPPLARSRGWEGVAEVRVEFDLGLRPEVVLSRSSGYELLDAQALAMMKLAIASAILPDALRGDRFSVPIPISFSLED